MECIIDNTVNRLIESYRTLVNDLNDVEVNLPLFDPEENVQETAVLSAICEHGLHHPDPPPEEPIQEIVGSTSSVTQEGGEDIDFLAISEAINRQGLYLAIPRSLPNDSSPDSHS